MQMDGGIAEVFRKDMQPYGMRDLQAAVGILTLMNRRNWKVEDLYDFIAYKKQEVKDHEEIERKLIESGAASDPAWQEKRKKFILMDADGMTAKQAEKEIKRQRRKREAAKRGEGTSFREFMDKKKNCRGCGNGTR